MSSTSQDPIMASHSFQILSDQEVIDMKRTRGIMACAECQRRKLKCDKKFPCTSCVRRGRADICPTGDMGPIGRGRRVMRSVSLELSTTIHSMGDRIRQLESAIAEAHAADGHSGEASVSPHPLLRDDLLSISHTNELPQSSGDPTPAPNTFGALAVSASGTPRYFGPTAGPSVSQCTTENRINPRFFSMRQALLSVQGGSGADRAEYAPLFADVVESFPFGGTQASSSWDTTVCLETLLGQLPDELRAWALYDIFVADASWYGTPIMADELHELLAFLYDPNSNLHDLTPHALAVVFFCFAAATYADLALPAYSPQADTYFDLGRTALTLQPVFGSTDLHTIQALALAALYYATGGPRYSVDSSWTLTSMAIGLCQALRLYREREHTRFENKVAQRRRALFWEIYSLETYQSLSFSRPLTISLADITCEFPADTDETMDSQGMPVPGFFHTRWTFTKEVTAPMAQAYTSAMPLTYDEVLDLDRRLRRFMERAPFPHYYNKPGEARTFLAYVRSHLIPRFAGNLMLYIHRGSFVQALKDRPLNPLEGPYAASFLAAYRGASVIIKSDVRSLALFPEHFHRWWPIWKSLVNASFIVGSIVAKSPTTSVAPAALAELLTAVDLVEHGAVHSFAAEGSLPVLYRLRNKATAVYAAFRPLAAPLHSVNLDGEADDKDFELLGGSHAIVQRDTVSVPVSASNPSSPSPSPSRCPQNGGLAMPSLIPGLMPPPSSPDHWEALMPAHWPWSSSFPFEMLMKNASASGSSTSASASSEDANGSEGLEAYLAAQLPKFTTGSFPCGSVGGSPVSEAEWTQFLSIMEH
ncbi:fungal-specific transcription factor domain-containing protein [Mycena vitilis]|nr:fungal-specific transcription factor domain-containing protein [Mycena vitilis]